MYGTKASTTVKQRVQHEFLRHEEIHHPQVLKVKGGGLDGTVSSLATCVVIQIT